QFRGGLNGTSGNYDYFAEMAGSVSTLDGKIFPANEVYDSFAVVSTSGFDGIPVKYENQIVGVTDEDGYLLVPWATAYYTAKYEIDPLTLPANAAFSTTEQFASIHAGYGYLLEFPIELQIALSMTVVDENHLVLPLGTFGRSETGLVSQIGWDG
ncbi:fimbria/pilus outer membrane usher protein, partial [Salmonella enterica subsp. enterica serovar Typhimurium]